MSKGMILGISGLMGSGKDTVADHLVAKHGFVKIGLADPLKRFVAEVYGFSFSQLWGPSQMRNIPDERYPRDHTYNDSLASLADATCLCCGWDSSVGSPEVPQCYLTPRYALMMLGTEWGRGCYDKTWIEYGLRVADELSIEQWSGWSYSVAHGKHRAGTCKGPNHPDCVMGAKGVVFSDFRFKNEIYPAKEKGVQLWRTLRGTGKPVFDHPSETEQMVIPDAVFNQVIDNNGITKEELYIKVGDLVSQLPW